MGIPGITSRLKVPNLIAMDGPNNTTYSFTPVQDVYYNTYNNAPAKNRERNDLKLIASIAYKF